MNNSDFCNILNYKLSDSSKRSMNELRNVMDLGNYAAVFTASMCGSACRYKLTIYSLIRQQLVA